MKTDYLQMSIHVLVPIILAGLMNAFIYMQGWNKESGSRVDNNNAFLPPGYVIAIVWIIILGLLGYTHFLVYPSTASWVIVFAVLYCLAYPFLTSGLQTKNAFIYNLLSLIIALFVFGFVYSQNVYAAMFTIPFILWTLYVNIVTNLPKS